MPLPIALILALAGVVLLPGCAATTEAVAADQPQIREIPIRTDPPGAQVHVIGGRVGTTPLSINERDIYPNTYDPERQHLYGKVILRKEGCEPYERQLTLADIRNGLSVDLKCTADERSTVTAEPASPSVDTVAEPGSASTDAQGESSAARRLRQLQTLQELFDDGYITASEEQRIRTRILNGTTVSEPGSR